MSIFLGMDEVGRGALAGPVITGCVGFEQPYAIEDKRVPVRINDSKKLSAQQRQESALWIYENALCWGIGVGSVTTINNAGIVAAANSAFRKGYKASTRMLHGEIDLVLVDAFYIPRLGIPKSQQKAIIRGDQKEFCIAAASIIAKVYRDTLMEKLGSKKPHREYIWHKNKGYGTAEHIAAIKRIGATKHHRTLFVRNIV